MNMKIQELSPWRTAKRFLKLNCCYFWPKTTNRSITMKIIVGGWSVSRPQAELQITLLLWDNIVWKFYCIVFFFFSFFGGGALVKFVAIFSNLPLLTILLFHTPVELLWSIIPLIPPPIKGWPTLFLALLPHGKRKRYKSGMSPFREEFIPAKDTDLWLYL